MFDMLIVWGGGCIQGLQAPISESSLVKQELVVYFRPFYEMLDTKVTSVRQLVSKACYYSRDKLTFNTFLTLLLHHHSNYTYSCPLLQHVEN